MSDSVQDPSNHETPDELAPPRRGHIMLAEDHASMLRLLASALAEDGFSVTEIEDGAKLFERVNAWLKWGDRESLAAIVSDVRLPTFSGLEVLATVREAGCELPFVLITANADRRTVKEAFDLGATAVFQKPFDIDEFRRAMVKITTRRGQPAGENG